MKIKSFFASTITASLLLLTSCNNDSNDDIPVEKGAYEGGILVGIEGAINKNQAEVSYLSTDLSKVSENIYAENNDKKPLGDILQTIAFKDDKAFLVVNNSNKIEIVNRYSFKKLNSFTSSQARGITFSGNNIYVSSNNFYNTFSVNIYDATTYAPTQSISLPRYAEKIVTAGNYVVVQSDGSTYETTDPYGEIPSGHTITTINTSSNTLDKTITLPDDGIIRDLISANGFAYVLSSGSKDSYIYEVNPATGSFTKSTLAGIPNASLLRFSGSNLYFADDAQHIYSKATTSSSSPVKLFKYDNTAGYYLYGMNIIDGKVFISNVNFNGPSKVSVYSLQGSLIKNLTLGNGVNGFFKN